MVFKAYIYMFYKFIAHLGNSSCHRLIRLKELQQNCLHLVPLRLIPDQTCIICLLATSKFIIHLKKQVFFFLIFLFGVFCSPVAVYCLCIVILLQHPQPLSLSVSLPPFLPSPPSLLPSLYSPTLPSSLLPPFSFPLSFFLSSF